ncbi:MAG: heavy-metal-associated domain-containing protein [Chloroflexi bacterium]|nr:heavy-metal-associated domain-containing protein [Chloroflexota bacterium]
MWSKTFKIPDICCHNCAKVVSHTLNSLAGVQKVEVDAKTKVVTVQWSEPATWQLIGTRLVESGYPPGPDLH